jgi:hypothetical protein
MTLGPVIARFEIADDGAVTAHFRGRPPLALGDQEDLANARAEVAGILPGFQHELGDHITLSSLSNAVRNLDREMRNIAFRLVRNDTEQLYRLMTFLTDAWQLWQRSTDEIPQIEILGRQTHFPFELLPLFDQRKFDDFANWAEAEDILRRFTGYVAVVRHITKDLVEMTPLSASPRLPVQLLTFNFANTDSEEDYFGRSLDRIDLEGPWPGADLDSPQVTDQLIGALYDPMMSLAGTRRQGGPVQIQHFACHGHTDFSSASGFGFELGTDQKSTRVTLGSIMTGYAQLRCNGNSDVARPLIIANACGTAKVDPRSHGSFQSWFLSNRHRGFVGTEIDVPTETAFHFTVRLYDELFAGRSLGEAIVRARRRLLAERGSPYGLFYVLYGNPEMAIV